MSMEIVQVQRATDTRCTHLSQICLGILLWLGLPLWLTNVAKPTSRGCRKVTHEWAIMMPTSSIWESSLTMNEGGGEREDFNQQLKYTVILKCVCNELSASIVSAFIQTPTLLVQAALIMNTMLWSSELSYHYSWGSTMMLQINFPHSPHHFLCPSPHRWCRWQ